MLEFGLPIYESYLDKLSSWNQGVVFYFVMKAIYSKASVQINSIKTVNTGGAYHGREAYKQGFQFGEVSQTVRANINLNIENNPLNFYLDSLIDQFHKRSPSNWGDGPIDKGKFKISKENKDKFGKQLNSDILKYFNMCGSFFQLQAKWWKSNLCRNVQSSAIDTVLRHMKSCI